MSNFSNGIPGLVTVNKKLAEKLANKKKGSAEPAQADPKKKAGAPPPKEAPPPKKDAPKGKGAPTAEEEAAEAERIRLEAETAERRRMEEIERNFDKHGELKSIGGSVTDFDTNDESLRTQHYDWLLPVYYKIADRAEAEVNCFYL